MGRVLTLLIIFLLALGSGAGYFILTEKITAGSLKITAGEKQLEQGEQMLNKGKAKLVNGEHQLSQGKEVHKNLETATLVGLASVTPVGLAALEVGEKVTGKKVAEGEKLVVRGREKIKSGEEQLLAGKLELQHGKEKLNKANVIRKACGVGSILFTLFLILLGFYWRKP